MKLTQNNHESMKTVVETFLTEETVELIYDNEQLDKWNSYVEELGLKGQKQIVKPTKSPIPFMHLKQSNINICKQLCPRAVKIEDYNVTPIPVEILDLVALSKRENYFESIEIWYDEKSPDPFVIGANYVYYSTNNNQWKTRHNSKSSAQQEMTENGWIGKPAKTCDFQGYLIGKWADVKRSWEELKQMAIERFISEEGNRHQKQIQESKRALEDLQTLAFDKFN